VKTQKITTSAILIALSIVIPIYFPRIQVEPASFTLASHVPIFIAIFVSPVVAVMVAIGSGIGFFISSTPVIALRAASHVVFALAGSLYIKSRPETLLAPMKTRALSLVLALIHSACELIVIFAFYLGAPPNYDSLWSVFLVLGLGFAIHSMIDYEIALAAYKVLIRQKSIARLFENSR
jgi:niacin transporter